MRILIINLDHEKQRMEFQNGQMKRLGLKFERLPAITTDDIPPRELATRALQWERPLREVEVACLYSHRSAWNIVAQGNKPVLILEDDVLLSSKTPKILSSLENAKNADHVTLEIRGRKKLLGLEAVKLNDNTFMSRLYQDRTGAGAYVLWPKAALVLLEKSGSAAGLADAVIAAAYEISSWQIEPAAAMQLDQCASYGIDSPLETVSAISLNSNDKPSSADLLMSLNFRCRRYVSQLRMGLRHLSSLTRARRRFAKVEISDFQAHITGWEN